MRGPYSNTKALKPSSLLRGLGLDFHASGEMFFRNDAVGIKQQVVRNDRAGFDLGNKPWNSGAPYENETVGWAEDKLPACQFVALSLGDDLEGHPPKRPMRITSPCFLVSLVSLW